MNASAPASTPPVTAAPHVESGNRGLLLFLGFVALMALAPFVGGYPVFLMKVLCFALFACAFNLLIGYVGLLSFGHAMFFGMSAYVSAHTVKVLGWNPEFGILAGAAVAAVLGLIVGLIAIRRQGIYFAMVTLALSQMVFFFCLQAPFTGGEDGIQSIPRNPFLGIIDTKNDLTMYYIVLAIFVACFALIYRTIHSPFGQVLKAIRENEPRAISLGYDVAKFKLLAFVISAFADFFSCFNVLLIDLLFKLFAFLTVLTLSFFARSQPSQPGLTQKRTRTSDSSLSFSLKSVYFSRSEGSELKIDLISASVSNFLHVESAHTSLSNYLLVICSFRFSQRHSRQNL
jgi:branched-subunit amino acid ABC-type transport system permease component